MRIPVLFLALVAAALLAEARPWYADRIPNGHNVMLGGELWPGVGHLARGGGGDRNPFGLDFEAAGYAWTSALCMLDSDGDGTSNGDELGDETCSWSEGGGAPDRTVNITHPGINEATYDNTPSLAEARCDAIASETDIDNFELTFPTYALPASPDTHYTCHDFVSPLETPKEHAIRFEPLVDNSNVVHHMILYLCNAPPPDANRGFYDCSDMEERCSELLWAWAVGADDICLPPEAGFAIGTDYATHMAIQIHYNNVELTAGIEDSSGVRVHHTANLRPQEATIMQLGPQLRDIEIPAGDPAWTIDDLCSSDSTERLNDNTLEIFAVALHMHEIGDKMVVEHYENGDPGQSGTTQLDDLLRNDAYDFNRQEFVAIEEVTLKSADSLRTQCTFNAANRTVVTVGGDRSTDEMCYAYLMFYGEPEVVDLVPKSCSSASSTSSALVAVWIGVGACLCLTIAGVAVACVVSRRKRDSSKTGGFKTMNGGNSVATQKFSAGSSSNSTEST